MRTLTATLWLALALTASGQWNVLRNPVLGEQAAAAAPAGGEADYLQTINSVYLVYWGENYDATAGVWTNAVAGQPNLTAPDAGSKPTTMTQNGYSVPVFDGVNDRLMNDNVGWGESSELFFLVRIDPTRDEAYEYIYRGTGTTFQRMLIDDGQLLRYGDGSSMMTFGTLSKATNYFVVYNVIQAPNWSGVFTNNVQAAEWGGNTVATNGGFSFMSAGYGWDAVKGRAAMLAVFTNTLSATQRSNVFFTITNKYAP